MWLSEVLKIYISSKSYQNPIVIADNNGVWIQWATTPYIKWDKIATVGSKNNRNRGYVCELKREGKFSYEFTSIPEDVETIRLLHSEFLSLKSIEYSNEADERI